MEKTIYKKNLAWRMRKIGNRNILMSNLSAFELNDIGNYIWNSIDGDSTIDEISSNLAQEYKVSVDTTLKDIIKFCGELETLNAIIPKLEGK